MLECANGLYGVPEAEYGRLMGDIALDPVTTNGDSATIDEAQWATLYGIAPFRKAPANVRVKRYRERAEELRTIAEDLVQSDCQGMMARLAASYDAMADSEERRTR